jgi:hypothetical protein
MESKDERIVYIQWKSPSRLFKKRDKDFFRNVAAIVFLLLVILIFAREFALIIAVISVSFLVYVFSTIPPEEVEHTISNKGIDSAGRTYDWENLLAFWFEKQWDQQMLILTMENGARLTMLLGGVEEQQLKEILSRFLRYEEEPQKTFVDNAARWLSKKVPLEKPSS